MPLLRPVNFCELLGYIRAQQQVAAFERVLLRFPQVLGSLTEIAFLAGNYTNMPKDLSAPWRWIVSVDGKEFLALRESFIEAASRDIELNLVDREVQLPGMIAVFLESLSGQVVGNLSVLE